MKARVISLMAAVAILLVSQTAGALVGPTCPSPAPSCTSSGTLSNFYSGTYGCTLITTNSAGGVQGQFLPNNPGRPRNNSRQAGNKNHNPSGAPFSGFTALTTGATYC